MYGCTFKRSLEEANSETKKRMSVTGVWRWGHGELPVNRDRFSVIQDEKVLEMDGGSDCLTT